MATEEEIRADIREMVEEGNIKDPMLRQAIKGRGVIPEVEEKVQMSLGLRDLVQLFPARVRGRIMEAGGHYKASRREHLWWTIQDRICDISRGRIFGIKPPPKV